MTEMSFMPRLARYLKSNGMIYTVRGSFYRTPVVSVEGVGSCRRVCITAVMKPDDLAPYVEFSGFNDIATWWAKIQQLHRHSSQLYLYKVGVLK